MVSLWLLVLHICVNLSFMRLSVGVTLSHYMYRQSINKAMEALLIWDYVFFSLFYSLILPSREYIHYQTCICSRSINMLYFYVQVTLEGKNIGNNSGTNMFNIIYVTQFKLG